MSRTKFHGSTRILRVAKHRHFFFSILHPICELASPQVLLPLKMKTDTKALNRTICCQAIGAGTALADIEKAPLEGFCIPRRARSGETRLGHRLAAISSRVTWEINVWIALDCRADADSLCATLIGRTDAAAVRFRECWGEIRAVLDTADMPHCFRWAAARVHLKAISEQLSEVYAATGKHHAFLSFVAELCRLGDDQGETTHRIAAAVEGRADAEAAAALAGSALNLRWRAVRVFAVRSSALRFECSVAMERSLSLALSRKRAQPDTPIEVADA